MGRLAINNGTVAGDNTGEILFSAFEKCNDNFIELYDVVRHGIYDYDNALSAQSFTGTPIVLQNDDDGANSYKNVIPGVVEIFNSSTHEFNFSDLQIGDYIQIRVDLAVTTTSANQEINVYLDLAQGTASNYQISLGRRFFKTATTHNITDIVNFVYMGNVATKDNPAQMMFNSDANATVLVNGWACIAHRQLV
jgi:hypothetical protein